ncbi:MAG: hypothetical protein JJU12_03985 [Chlamydiales bacterium]|nr:hypothetical protein [Chlamydiales bacterium]
MSFLPSSPLYAGIDVNGSSVHIARMRKTRKGWEVAGLKTYLPEELVNPLDIGMSVAPISSRETLVRSCELQIKNEKDIKAALAFQLEPQLPYSAEKAVIQAQTIEKKPDRTLLTAFAVRKDHLQARLESLHEKGVEPEIVTCAPYALAALTTLFPQTASPQFLVHEGEEEVTCILVEKGKLLAARAFDKKCELGREVEKTILSFSSSHKTKEFETILLLGKENDEIQKATGKTVLFPSTSTLSLSEEELVRYGLSIGAALAGEGLDFRQGEFAYPHRWRRVKKPLLAYLALSAILVGSLFGFGQIALKQQKEAVERAYFSLLEGEGKLFNREEAPKAPIDYLLSLNQLEKEVGSRPDIYALLPGVPKVRELLAWLSDQQSIEVESMNYAMVKRPDFSHKNERYKVKVELEFSARDIRAANAFHDLLLSPSKFVDPKEEVQWTTMKGRYRTTFYLKDKTRYT